VTTSKRPSDRFHGYGASGVSDAVLVSARNGADDAEFSPFSLSLPDHFAIAVLKNMQRDGSARKGHELEWEKR
jgi:hypothetical protein